MSEDKKLKVTYSPEFIEQLSHLDEDTREELMVALSKFTDDLEKNPHLGTPLFGPPWFRAWNWVKRQYRRVRPLK